MQSLCSKGTYQQLHHNVDQRGEEALGGIELFVGVAHGPPENPSQNIPAGTAQKGDPHLDITPLSPPASGIRQQLNMGNANTESLFLSSSHLVLESTPSTPVGGR